MVQQLGESTYFFRGLLSCDLHAGDESFHISALYPADGDYVAGPQ